MADWLLLRLPRTPGGLASWLVAGTGGAPLAATASGALTDAVPAAVGRRVCVLVPGSDVLLAEPELPLRSGVRPQQVVPYALEEQLAEDIDALHFAIGKRAADSTRTPVAVVSRTLMEEWLAALTAAGLNPECMYADSELLPLNPSQSVALLEEDAVFVRLPGASPVCLPADALAEALQLAAAAPAAAAAAASEPGAAAGGLILYSGTQEWSAHSALVEAARDRFVSLKVQLLGDGPLALFAQQLPTTSAVNLLQGTYAPKGASAVGFAAWRVAALLLVCLIGLHVAGKAAELRLLKARERAADSALCDTFRTALPGRPCTGDLRQQMEERLRVVRGSGGANGLLGALQALAQARTAAPGTSVQSLNFHDGGLEMTLNAPDAASLNRLSEQLRNNGWQSDLIGGNTVGNVYQGRVQIRAQGP
ncbi:MAG TPA: type II secretion system protein GspL [Steroidobacteraceae bacterium]|nr:type II secretion system protein GspL [Steroidobacteraceae bacterium]